MQVLNEILFLLLNAPPHPGAATVLVARFFAEVAIWAVPLALVAGWLRGGNATRKRMLEAAAAGLVGLL
ncbi:MAG TPA: undecaprenyl-diphosphatase, partial [Polaromonas sp.]|nr:undecaprenyl-diphosphatase [Polaromonas sp.]